MLKLVKGVVSFHENVLPGLRTQFAQLSLGQSPDALMISCSDSRVVPNLFASTDPGDLVVVRNIGNLVPRSEEVHGESEAAAIEIALERLKVRDIIVCGHSQCAGMAALLAEEGISPNVQRWLRHGLAARRRLDDGQSFDKSLTRQDQLSQLSVMHQLENLRTYDLVEQGLTAGALRLHGWWFDIGTGNVYAFEPEQNKFSVIDEAFGRRIIEQIGN